MDGEEGEERLKASEGGREGEAKERGVVKIYNA